MMQKIGSFLCLGFLLVSYPALAKKFETGPWRFELKTTYAVIPFIMDLKNEGGQTVAVIHNGKEDIVIKNVKHKKDQLSIPLQTYEQSLELTIESKKYLKGLFVRHNKNPKVELIISGKAGENKRYPGDRAPSNLKLSGKWAVTLNEDGKLAPGVVVFEQAGDEINGSILTPTGDYRYFHGYSSGDSFEASSFDGSYYYVFRGSVTKGKLKASILSNSQVNLEGVMDDKAKLPDAYAQTQLSAIDFALPDVNDKFFSLKHKKFAGKPVIIQIFGSWCPNCIDEMNFLIPWYKSHQSQGIEVVALAFERSLSLADAKRQLKKVVDQKKVTYPVLLAGATSEDKPMDKIKNLKNFISFPTTVFLNRKHEVVKVHAGFSGPSTGEFFEEWKKEFNETVKGLLKK